MTHTIIELEAALDIQRLILKTQRLGIPEQKSIECAIDTLTKAIAIARGEMVVVPREPTEEMYRFADEAFWSREHLNRKICYTDIYKAMINAAQEGEGDE